MSHDTQNPSRWVTVPSRKLSLWQSAAEQMLMTPTAGGAARCRSRAEVLRSPVMAGVNRHVKIRVDGAMVSPPDGGPATPSGDSSRHAYTSYLRFEMAEAKRTNDQARYDRFAAAWRQYSTDDPGWLTCETTYLQYLLSTGGTLQYNDWTQQGNNNIDYSVIDWQLPNDAAVAIIGDWGTGLPDAQALVAELMMLKKPPSAILHLGDIYYSSTPQECPDNFASVLAAAAPNVPVFTIPGNHDYYDWGTGFYQMLPQLNADPKQLQPASYFCLQTRDQKWQFLGADTGQGDSDPLDELVPRSGPSLRPSEIKWHQDKLTKFTGSTLLMTHHQFFSAASTINDNELPLPTDYPPYINMNLGNTFAPFFNRISAWFWGHEHSLYLFGGGIFGLSLGRLVGSSAYEEATTDSPYNVAFPQVPFNQSVELQAVAGYYPHTCAVVDLERSDPGDPISITYYQTPSWYQSPPNPLPGLTPLLTETIYPAT